MVMKKYDKTTFRLFKSQITRFLTLIAMIFISVSFMSGIGESQSKIQSSLTQYYQEQNIPDFILKSHSQTGFSQEQIQLLQKVSFGLQSQKICHVLPTTHQVLYKKEALYLQTRKLRHQ